MAKILITGASGFVGSFLITEALSRNLEVFAGIRKTSSKKWLQDPRINFVELNLSDRDALSSILASNKFDYVIHNAGLTKAIKASDLIKVNATYTHNLAVAAQFSESIKKFTFMSSLAAYGTADYQADGVVSINSKPHPITSYGVSKLRGEEKLKSIEGLPWMILRPTGVFGPRESDFLNIFQTIQKGIALQVGFSEQKLSLIYVKDLARVVLDATLSNLTNKEYFVSDGRIYSGSLFNDLISKSLGKSPITIKVPMGLVSVLARLSDINSKITGKANILSRDKLPEIKSRNLDCDISNLVSDLNFQPNYTLEDALIETAEWYKKEGWL